MNNKKQKTKKQTKDNKKRIKTSYTGLVECEDFIKLYLCGDLICKVAINEYKTHEILLALANKNIVSDYDC